MMTDTKSEIRDLLERLSRLNAADNWSGSLNPTQRTALSYLARANLFSRSPSHVADYLGATRGTVSMTLKALAQKQMIREIRSESDKRSISYEVTSMGFEELKPLHAIDRALLNLQESALHTLSASLKHLIEEMLKLRDGRQFGICKDCHYHQSTRQGAFCALLNLPLEISETDKLCHEFKLKG
ncbi:MAG: MarR family winged helix-turn-helix transcriptional regulator [Sneathiellales bacterium]|nr:MarR family winged helix-turn-helix transcriptional regulator [Sneathiellales bacterium]